MLKTREVTIDAPATSRDLGKRFLIKEMPAVQAEAWAIRAMGAMARGGVEIPDNIMQGGLVAFTAFGLKALMGAPYVESAPLLAEMMDCVQIIEPAITRKLLDTDIEEVATILRLRDEVIELHTGFSIAAVLLGMAADLATPEAMSEQSNTPTPVN